ncbi:MAG: PucC family protein [Pseudomonadota bacterium]
MQQLKNRLIAFYSSLGSRYLPFADVTTPDLPLSRLLRLSLFQISVGMTLVLLVGTLNRVMIVELGVPAMVVGVMIALPLLFAPLRALIGHKSDTHRCELGWRRVPYIWRGSLLQFGGYAIMPFAILVLAGRGEAAHAPQWIGYASAAAAFLLVGAGAHIVQTAGLALATDLTPPESHPRVVGLMYIMLLFGMIGSALLFGIALDPFYAPRLIQVIQGAAVACVVLNFIAAWKQEARSANRRPMQSSNDPSFTEAWAHFCKGAETIHRLMIVGLGTIAFAMSEVLLEPYGGEVLQWTVASTTKLTALLALGSLVGLAAGSYILRPGIDPNRISLFAAALGVPAFALICFAAPLQADWVFLIGNLLVGIGAALFAHATLTATMNQATPGQAGLALGAWGAVQATAAGAGMAIGSILRDAVEFLFGSSASLAGTASEGTGYLTVYALEICLLLVTIAALIPLVRRTATSSRPSYDANEQGRRLEYSVQTPQKGS